LPEVIELLKFIRQGQKPDYQGVVFLNNRKRPWTKGTLGQKLRRMKSRGEVTTKAGLHGLRHAFGTEAIRNGAPIKAVSLQLGHSTTVITERFYCHLNNDTDFMREAAQFALPKKAIGG
jgi:site-specific recombinase XerD